MLERVGLRIDEEQLLLDPEREVGSRPEVDGTGIASLG